MTSKVNGTLFHSRAGADVVNGSAGKSSFFQRGLPGRSSMVHTIANTTFGGTLKRGQPGRATMVQPNSRPLYLNREAKENQSFMCTEEQDKTTSPHQKFKNIFARVKDGLKFEAVKHPGKIRRTLSEKTKTTSKSRSSSHENILASFHKKEYTQSSEQLPLLPPPPSYEGVKLDKYQNASAIGCGAMEPGMERREQGGENSHVGQQLGKENSHVSQSGRITQYEHTNGHIKITEYDGMGCGSLGREFKHAEDDHAGGYRGETRVVEHNTFSPPSGVESHAKTEHDMVLEAAGQTDVDATLAEYDNLQRKLNYELLLLKSDQELMRMVSAPPLTDDYIHPPEQWQEPDRMSSSHENLLAPPAYSQTESSLKHDNFSSARTLHIGGVDDSRCVSMPGDCGLSSAEMELKDPMNEMEKLQSNLTDIFGDQTAETCPEDSDRHAAGSPKIDGILSGGISQLIKKYENYEEKVGKGPSMNLAKFRVTRKSTQTVAHQEEPTSYLDSPEGDGKNQLKQESLLQNGCFLGQYPDEYNSPIVNIRDDGAFSHNEYCDEPDISTWAHTNQYSLPEHGLRKWPNMEDIGRSQFDVQAITSAEMREFRISVASSTTGVVEDAAEMRNSRISATAPSGYEGDSPMTEEATCFSDSTDGGQSLGFVSQSDALPVRERHKYYDELCDKLRWRHDRLHDVGGDGEDDTRDKGYLSLGSQIGESNTDNMDFGQSVSGYATIPEAELYGNGPSELTKSSGDEGCQPSEAFLDFLRQHMVQDPDVTVSFYDIDTVAPPEVLNDELDYETVQNGGSVKDRNILSHSVASSDRTCVDSANKTGETRLGSCASEVSYSVGQLRQRFSMPDVIESVVDHDKSHFAANALDVDNPDQSQLKLIESLKQELHEARRALGTDGPPQSTTCLGFAELDWYGSSWRAPSKTQTDDTNMSLNTLPKADNDIHWAPTDICHTPFVDSDDRAMSKTVTHMKQQWEVSEACQNGEIIPPPEWENEYSVFSPVEDTDQSEADMLNDLEQAFNDVLFDNCMPSDLKDISRSEALYDKFTPPPPVAEVPPLNRFGVGEAGDGYYGDPNYDIDDDLETICEENMSDVDVSPEDIDNDSDDSFEPPWADSVGAKGEVFYVEPAEHHSEPPAPILTDSTKITNGANNKELQNNRKKKGLKKTVSKLIKPHKIEQRESNNNTRNKHNNHANLSVTFNDVPTGVLKDVYLFVDPTRHNYGRRATLCEALFGIVPGRFGSKSGHVNGTNPDRRIMVQALLPGGEALKSGDVKIGDWLMCINDLEINTDNVDSILSAITGPREVKVTLQKLSVAPVPRAPIQRSPAVNEPLVQLISGERLHEVPPSLKDVPHLAMYLTLDASSESANSKEDLLYEFPTGDSKLIAIRGLFITLSHILLDVTDNTAKNSTLLVDNRLVHVGYGKEGREVLILAMPANKVSLQQVNCVVADVIRLVKLLYGSLHSAFSSKENHRRLDHLFSLIFQHHLLAEELLLRGSPQSQFVEPFYETMAGVRTLTLPEETKVLINNCLSEFEAADFADMSDDFYEMRRSYSILGSCLFYKGYLVGNHLPSDDLYDLSLYLRSHCLLTLCNQEQMGQLVIWTEVFPWRRCHKQTEPLIPGYTEPDSRFFYLVVGMKNNMLATILEAGGCASWAQGHPSPDPFFVDQAKATLLQLESLDVINQCEFRLLAPPVPSLACSDWFLPKNAKEDGSPAVPLIKVYNIAKSATPPSKKLLQPESILKKNNSPRDRPHGRGAVYDVESDGESHSTGNSESSTPVLDRRKASAGSDESGGSGSTGSSSFFKGTKRRRNMLSAFDLSGMKRDLNELPAADELGSLVKLPSGCDNTLLTYVQLDSAEGIYICPSQQEMAPLATPLHRVILSHFHRAAITIRQRLHHTLSVKKEGENSSLGRFGLSKSLGNVIEHGVLFQYEVETSTDSKKSPPTLNYWVIGRLFPEPYPREFYVCFQDSSQQNLVELAFKLGFGMAL